MKKLKTQKLSFEAQEKLWHLLIVLIGVQEKNKKFNVGSWETCLLGHAAKDKWFQRKGLSSVESRWDNFEINYGYATGIGAGRDFFDIPLDTSIALFGGGGKYCEIKSVVIELERWLLACEKRAN